MPYRKGISTRHGWHWNKRTHTPKTAPTEVALFRKCYESKRKRGQDPDIWIAQLEEIKMRLSEMKNDISDKHSLLYFIIAISQEKKKR
jgi:hypothetical protein